MNQRHLWQREGKGGRKDGAGSTQLGVTCDRESSQHCQVGAGTRGQEKIRPFFFEALESLKFVTVCLSLSLLLQPRLHCCSASPRHF